jgi:hypothetical protein
MFGIGVKPTGGRRELFLATGGAVGHTCAQPVSAMLTIPTRIRRFIETTPSLET